MSNLKVDMIIHSLSDDDIMIVWIESVMGGVNETYHFALPSANNDFDVAEEYHTVCSKVLTERGECDIMQHEPFGDSWTDTEYHLLCPTCVDWLMSNQHLTPFRLENRIQDAGKNEMVLMVYPK